MNAFAQVVSGVVAVCLFIAGYQGISYLMERDGYSWKLLGRDIKNLWRRWFSTTLPSGTTAPSLPHPSAREARIASYRKMA